MNTLRGITWDHPRGFDSIVASSDLFHQENPEIRIEWVTRSLKEFGDQPIAELVEQFDLLMIDHPFVGEAHKNNLLTPLENLMPSSFLNQHKSLHIGQCFQSYTYDNSQFALPVDASAQFSAFNSAIIPKTDIPVSWDQYLDLLKNRTFRDSVIWPLCPTDLWCSLLSICAQINSPENKFLETEFNDEVFYEGIERLKMYTEGLNPLCWKTNPIEALEQLSNKEYGYSPLLFGYCHYANRQTSIQFTNPISINSEKPVSLLGGVGISVSALSTHRKAIVQFLSFLFDGSSIHAYFHAGGQPSLKEVWLDEKMNNNTHNFFLDTILGMENAYMRPRKFGFHNFQNEAVDLVFNQFRNISTSQMVELLREAYKKHMEN